MNPRTIVAKCTSVKSPCVKECEERTGECKLRCDKYAEYELQYREALQKRIESKKKEDEFYSYHNAMLSKNIRRSR